MIIIDNNHVIGHRLIITKSRRRRIGKALQRARDEHHSVGVPWNDNDEAVRAQVRFRMQLKRFARDEARRLRNLRKRLRRFGAAIARVSG